MSFSTSIKSLPKFALSLLVLSAAFYATATERAPKVGAWAIDSKGSVMKVLSIVSAKGSHSDVSDSLASVAVETPYGAGKSRNLDLSDSLAWDEERVALADLTAQTQHIQDSRGISLKAGDEILDLELNAFIIQGVFGTRLKVYPSEMLTDGLIRTKEMGARNVRFKLVSGVGVVEFLGPSVAELKMNSQPTLCLDVANSGR